MAEIIFGVFPCAFNTVYVHDHFVASFLIGALCLEGFLVVDNVVLEALLLQTTIRSPSVSDDGTARRDVCLYYRQQCRLVTLVDGKELNETNQTQSDYMYWLRFRVRAMLS